MVQDNLANRTTEVRELIRSRRLDDARSKCEALCQDYPDDPEAWFLLGSLAGQGGDFSRAAICFRKVTDLDPQHAGAFVNLGRALDRSENHEEAEPVLRRALELRPQDPSIYFLLGRALHMQNKHDEAIAMYLKVVDFDPNNVNAYFNLGQIYQIQGDFPKAEDSYRRALQGNPGHVGACANLGHVLLYQEKLEQAENALTKALGSEPDSVQICHDFGLLRYAQGRYSEAKTYYERTLAKDPTNWAALSDLGLLYKDMGQIDEAVHLFRRAIELEPAFVLAHWNLCVTLNYQNDIDSNSIYLAHVHAAKFFANPDLQLHFHDERVPTKQLKVGFVSGDLREHSVGYFIEALLLYYDRSQLDVTCYMTSSESDAMSERLRRLADHWTTISTMSDSQVVERIRDDGIDILVDLSGYSENNRLGVFARRAAPVQVTYLGYPNTTGLKEMDYRLTDNWADPEGMTERFHTEKLVRLKGGFLSYTPPVDAPEVKPLPALSMGYITLGSFNYLGKVNEQVVTIWAAILAHLKDACLILKNKALRDAGVREHCWSIFERCGIERERIELFSFIDAVEGHLGLYNRVDICLDTFPYNGTTTTCEALWMGVPVVVLAGDRHAGRVGVSLLEQMQMTDWIAYDVDSYVARAVSAAQDLATLAHLRAGLRDRMASSLLCDGQRLARELEESFRHMWERWCAQSGSDQS